MTQASTLKFSQFLIKLGNGAAPEVFSAPCGLNSRGFSRTAATNDTNVPDCDNPDAPSWLERDVVSLSGQMTGSGVVADEDFDIWNSWFESGVSKTVHVTLGTRTWQGKAILSKLDITAQRGQRVTFSATLDSDGEIALQ
ncbi:phage tail tube protein [Bradyrhizobium diazoefficiens]|uniref:phage tail tube protein n=1 Tax=Bradyrhizobium diazoefficiens TaxID=1355477 RepID=UPI003838CD07